MKPFALRGGVNQILPRALCTPGMLEDCYNYEVGRDFGYAGIQGFEAFDGRMCPSTRDIWEITVPSEGIAPVNSGKSIDVNPENATPQSISFSPDGLNLFMLGDTTSVEVFRYVLQVPWDISTANYISQSKVLTNDTAMKAIHVSNSGHYLYAVGATNDTVYQYSLGDEFDLVSVNLTFSLDISGQETDPNGIYVSPDDTKLYITGISGAARVFEYTFAGDVSAATLANTYSLHVDNADPAGVTFIDSGLVFHVLDDLTGEIFTYACTTAWDVSTARLISTLDISATDASPADLYISPDGSYMYILGPTADTVYQYGWQFTPNENLTWTKGEETGDLGVVLSTTQAAETSVIRFAYWNQTDALPTGATLTGDITGVTFAEGLENATDTGKEASVVTQQGNAKAVAFSADGTKMYIGGDSPAGTLHQYTLSVAWDVSTATYASKTIDLTATLTGVFGIEFNDDGTTMVVIEGKNGVDEVQQFTLSTGWDITTASSAGKSFSTAGKVNNPRGMGVSADGKNVYVCGKSALNVDLSEEALHYSLSVAWDLSTATYVGNLLLPTAYLGSAQGIRFIEDGTKVYILDLTNKKIHQYSCSTPWVLSSAVYDWVSFDTPAGITTSDFALALSDGRLYIAVGGADKIHQYVNPITLFSALEDIATDQSDYQDQLFSASEIFRSAITPVPGSGVVSGIKWYKEQQQAVRDYYKYVFDIASDVTTTAEPQTSQHVVVIDGLSTLPIFGDEGIVRAVNVDSGAFDTEDAEGTIVVEPLTNSFDFSTRLHPRYTNELMTLAEIYFSSGSTEPVQGEQLSGQTSTETAYVFRVELQSGAWADGDAAGIIYAYTLTGLFTAAELMDRVTPSATNILTFDGQAYSSLFPVLQHVRPDHSGHDRAAMYRSSRTGWEKVDLGWGIRFDGGSNEPVVINSGADSLTQVVTAGDWKTAQQQDDLGGWTSSSGSEIDAVGAVGGGHVFPGSISLPDTTNESAFHFSIHDFDLQVPAGARVVGIEVEITALNADAATVGGALFSIQPYIGGRGVPAIEKRQALGDLTASFVAYTFGGEGDMWGTSFTNKNVNGSSFGLKFKMEWEDDGLVAGTDLQVDHVRVRIHYVPQSADIYFYDTVAVADYATAELVQLNLETGTWAGNDVVGSMRIYGLNRNQIPTKNIQIRDGAAGTGTLIADLDGSETLISLPGSGLVQENNSKYQMIAENAYAKDDLEAIYAVSGAGQGFTYDGNYVRTIHTGISVDLDKPRHLELFQFRLWLAYGWGEMAVSVAGAPLSFDGSLNAAALGYGRPITGLTKLPGKTMGVFTDQSTFTVKVEGASFDQQIMSPRNGAIEYTVQDVGNAPIYADPRGVAQPFATDKYGDFEAERQSHAIHPWLLDRLQGFRHDSVRNDGVVASTVARLKSQYRVYFADGYRMTMTMFGDNQPPEFTFQRLYTGGLPNQYIRVLATDADVGAGNQDRIFFTMDINPDHDHDDDLGYVYEDDRGTSFNGAAVKRWVELAPIVGVQIDHETTWATWHLYGLAHGWSTLALTSAVDFETPLDPDNTAEDANYAISLGASTNAVRTKPKTYKKKEKLQRKGSHISLRFQNESDRELPHVLQNITFVDEKAARKDG